MTDCLKALASIKQCSTLQQAREHLAFFQEQSDDKGMTPPLCFEEETWLKENSHITGKTRHMWYHKDNVIVAYFDKKNQLLWKFVYTSK